MSTQQKLHYTLSPDHPLVKLFNFMRDRGMIKAASYEDWRAHRNDPPKRKKDRTLAILEAMETARAKGAKKSVEQ